MANYQLDQTGAEVQAILDAVQDKETTRPVLNSSKLITSGAVRNALVEGYLYKGVADHTTNPGTPTEKVFYIASDPGTYSNFGAGISVAEGEVAILKYDTAWHKEVTGAATAAQVTELGQYVGNPEWVRVVVDNDGKILYGVKSDGNFYFGADCPPQIKEYVQAQIAAIDIDIDSALATKVDKVVGKSLINADYASSKMATENPEYLDAKVDSQNRILEGITKDGKKQINCPLDAPSYIEESVNSPEWLNAVTDIDGKVISGRKSNGVLVENVGIETNEMQAKKAILGDVSFTGDIPQQVKDYVANYVPESERVDAIPYNDTISIGSKIIKIYNPYKDSRSHQYTGQMHCHSWTKFTDHIGEFPYGYTIEQTEAMTAEERQAALNSVAANFVQRHKDEGYDFMALTNYAQFGDVTHKPAVMPANFLWLCDSYETVTFTLGVQQHMVVHCAPGFSVLYGKGTFDEIMNEVQDYGCIAQWPHPTDNSTFAEPEVIATVRKRLRLMEVWDGISMRKYDAQGDFVNYTVVKAGVMCDAPYDELITQGNFAFCMAISDERPTMGRTGSAMTTPNASKNIKNGCVKVFADNLTSEDIFNSLLTGNFYASSDADVNINSVTIANGRYTIDVGIEGVVVEFVKEGNTVLKTVNTSSGNTTAYYDFTGDEQFVRARIYKLNELPYDSDYWYYNKEWIVWTQPVFVSKTIL